MTVLVHSVVDVTIILALGLALAGALRRRSAAVGMRFSPPQSSVQCSRLRSSWCFRNCP